MSAIENRYDFDFFFDCQDGNPNGDPDADNSPRFDPETFQGLVSDVCLKRKVRDFVSYATGAGEVPAQGNRIFVMSGNSLESRQKEPYKAIPTLEAKKGKTAAGDIAAARDWMCQEFFDIRAFGAVMSTTEFNCGQVRGPVQFTFARSLDRVLSTEHTITRLAQTTEKDQQEKGAGTMGRKHTVAYGLYRAHGFINPVFAAQTKFSQEDLTLLWRALANLFELDRSAARGTMAARGLFIFQHASKLGNAPAQQLFDLVEAHVREGVEAPRGFADYVLQPPAADALPSGVSLIDGLAA